MACGDRWNLIDGVCGVEEARLLWSSVWRSEGNESHAKRGGRRFNFKLIAGEADDAALHVDMIFS